MAEHVTAAERTKSTHRAKLNTTFTPDYLARAAEQLGWDDTPAGKQKRLEDLALLQELLAVTRAAASSPIQGIARGSGAEQD